MISGKTTITRLPDGFAPVVTVGNDDRAVRVVFGRLTIYLSNRGDVSTVIVRGEAEDERGHRLPVETRGATDVKNQVEYRIVE